jgi:uncharacterized membrane protein YphA (DoxX/SURF4 family)
MSEFLAQPYLLYVPRLLVALLLIVGGAGKMANLKEFREILLAYDFLPRRIVPPFSALLPVVELVTGAVLLFKLFSPVAEFAAAALFLVFAIGIAINLLRGRNEVPCGCFSGRVDTISWLLVIRNLTLSSLVFLSIGRLVWVSLLLLALYGLGALMRSAPRAAQPST